MFWTVLALCLTVVMGGVIAYNGDLIGRKYGKRRITVLGLRPRHTAVLITIITGLVISAVTTGILFLVVPPVRDVIMEGEQAIRTKARLAQQNRDLLGLNSRLADQNAQLEGRNARLAHQQARARAEVLKVGRELAARQRELKRTQAALASAIANERMALHRVTLAQSEVATLIRKKAELSSAIALLTRRNAELAARNADLNAENARLARDNAAAVKYGEELGQDNERKHRENETLLRVNNALLDANGKLDEQNRVLTRKNAELEQRNAQLLKAGRELLVQSRTDLYELARRLEQMRTRRVVIHTGEDLARCIIPPNESPEGVRRAIDQLIHDANQTALARGAGPGENGVRAVRVVSKEFETITPFGNIHPIEVTETDRIDALVRRLAGADQPVCLLALAVVNSVDGEPALIDFQPYTDRLIYTRGRVVGSRRFDATEPVEKLYPEIMGFLKDLGRSAIDRGMIPTIDPATGNPQVGGLTWPELANLVDRVRSAGRRIVLTAVAAADTNASDPLRLNFRIDPAL